MSSDGVLVDPKTVSNASTGFNAARDAVDHRMTLAEEYATSARDWTYGYGDQLAQMLVDLDAPAVEDINIDVPAVPPISYTGRPSLGSIDTDVDWPTDKPTIGEIREIREIVPIDFPVFSYIAPTFDQVDKPDIVDIDDPGAAPQVTMPHMPLKPLLQMPDLPVINTVVIPDKPLVDVPVFESTFVEEHFDIPADFTWSESAYNSPVWNMLLSNVLYGLENGGTGLGVDVQADIWATATRRLDLDEDKAIQDIETYFASMGHEVPPGALLAAVVEISKETLRLRQDLNKELTIEEAKLAKEHTQYITDKALSLEEILREFHNAQMGRTLEAAKEVLAGAVNILNAKITQYNSKIEKYRADAAVFESRVKAVLTHVEIFKSQIEASKLEVEVQELFVSLYDKQVSALETTAKLYAAELEGSRLLLEYEKLRIDAFKTETDVYTARLGGQEVKARIYSEELKGEQIKAAVFSEQVKAYNGQVDAIKAESEINIKNVEAQMSQNIMVIEEFKALLDAYKTEIQASSAKLSANVEGFKGEVAGYSAETEAIGMQYTTIIKEIDVNIKRAELLTDQAIAKVDASTKGYVAIKDLQITGTKGLVDVGAQLTASAMTSVNANASLSASSSNSNSDSFSSSESLSESHGFEHEA